ncbi:hypothetical protein ABHI18_007768 [Aspergillus niger]
MTILSKDWYGLANAVSLMLSVIIRACILQANRSAIDRAVKAPEEIAKTILITPDSKVVTMFIPNNLIIPVFVRTPKPRQNWLYHLFQWAGWVSFAVHVLAIGMANLATQIYTVALVLLSSILICQKLGCDDSILGHWQRKLMTENVPRAYCCRIGSRLKATVSEWPRDMEFRELYPKQWRLKEASDTVEQGQRSGRRMDLYAWLNLTADEEDSLWKWDLLPHQRSHDNSWHEEFNAKKALISDKYKPELETIKIRAVRGVRGRNYVRFGVLADEESAMESRGPDPLRPSSPQRRASVLTTRGLLIEGQVSDPLSTSSINQ